MLISEARDAQFFLLLSVIFEWLGRFRWLRYRLIRFRKIFQNGPTWEGREANFIALYFEYWWFNCRSVRTCPPSFGKILSMVFPSKPSNIGVKSSMQHVAVRRDINRHELIFLFSISIPFFAWGTSFTSLEV